jgi:hypothetical protein
MMTLMMTPNSTSFSEGVSFVDETTAIHSHVYGEYEYFYYRFGDAFWNLLMICVLYK